VKIAISSNDGKFDTQFSSRFGRCDFFIFIDTETRSWESKPNPAVDAQGGAGAQVVQFLSKNHIETTITGRYGPTAFSALQAAGIQTYRANEGTPEELLDMFLDGKLSQVFEASGPGLH